MACCLFHPGRVGAGFKKPVLDIIGRFDDVVLVVSVRADGRYADQFKKFDQEPLFIAFDVFLELFVVFGHDIACFSD